MGELQFHGILLWSFLGLAAVTFPALLFIAAPYGRYTSTRFGPAIDRTVGWIVMEAASPILFGTFFLLGSSHWSPAAVAFLVCWETHYLHRAFIFPFRLRGRERKTATLMTVALGVVFNLMNGYLNGRWLFHLGPVYPASWLLDPRFLAGTLLFAAGLALNLHSDTLLMRLRAPDEQGYKIPRGGLFERVSCPNYLGEIVEWFGFALATWSLPGLAFALWTAANLGPRARTHHRWYREKFADYPPERRALIPFLV
jgi:protein-S-isoprenylcysteine O-methyltransferase Ste14